MRLYLFLGILLTAVSVQAQIGTQKHDGHVTGSWMSQDSVRKFLLVLDSHGIGQLDGKHVKYVTHRDKLHVTHDHVTTIFTFKLSGDTMNLSGGDLEYPLQLLRESESIHTTTSNTAPNEHNVPKELLGIWKGYNETIQFKSDAQCIYRGQIWPFVVVNDVVTMQTPQGNFLMKYKIADRKLYLSFSGTEHVYERTISEELVKTSEGRILDLSISGKWCYLMISPGASKSSECIQLNRDGSYEYSTHTSQGTQNSDFADIGTWWVENNEIHFHTEKEGSGSYTFEKLNHPENGDAMLSLNGKTFITASHHAPW